MPQARVEQIRDKIAGLRGQMRFLKEMAAQVEATPDHQVSLTDPDARSMNSSGRGTGIVGYNLQAAVDAQHHLIVAHEVVNEGNDRAQLAPMSQLAQAAIAEPEITVLADRGYMNGEQVLVCEGTGILPCVPRTDTSGKAQRGLFTKADFVYDADHDHYTCPAGKHLTKAPARSDHHGDIDHYRNLSACQSCVLRTVEHVFGTLKSWMGSTHFLTKTLKNVRTEMSLCVLAYNMKRMIQIMGAQPLITAIRT